jgi:hypothetical protein
MGNWITTKDGLIFWKHPFSQDEIDQARQEYERLEKHYNHAGGSDQARACGFLGQMAVEDMLIDNQAPYQRTEVLGNRLQFDYFLEHNGSDIHLEVKTQIRNGYGPPPDFYHCIVPEGQIDQICSGYCFVSYHHWDQSGYVVGIISKDKFLQIAEEFERHASLGFMTYANEPGRKCQINELWPPQIIQNLDEYEYRTQT